MYAQAAGATLGPDTELEPSAQTADAVAALRMVDIVVVGDVQALGKVQQAVGARGPARAQLRWSWRADFLASDVLVPDAGDARARCVIDLSRATLARLYFADAAAQRFLIRDLQLLAGLDELAKEELAQIIQASLEALLENTAAGLTREQVSRVMREHADPPHPLRRAVAAAATTSEQPSAASARRESSSPWSVDVFYAAQSYARRVAAAHGPGAGLTLRWPRRAPRISGWLTGQYWLPQRFEGELVGAKLDTVALRAGMSLERQFAERVAVGVRAGLGFDLVHVSPRTNAPERVTLTSEHWSSPLVVCVALRANFQLSRLMSVDVSLLADADFNHRHYDVQAPNGRNVVLEPWPVRPGVSVGLGTP